MSDWKEYKLDEISQILNNKRVPLSSMQRNIRKGKYPYYGASGIVDYIDDFIFDGEYVLISEDGENLKSRNTPIAFFAKGKFWVNNHSHIIKGKSDAINKWIIYYIKNLNISPYLTGAVQPKLNKENLLSIPFLLPSSNKELENIIEVLSSLDDKIELNNKINQELETLAQTLFKQWFIDFEFPNENGEPYKSSGGEMVVSEFGEIPKEWEIGKIGDYIKFIKGKKPLEVFDTESENTLPQILIETLDTGKSMFAKPEKMTICEKEDLIMVMDGASSGRIEIGFRGILGSTLAIIKSNGINNNLLYQFLKFKEQDIRNNTTGAAIPHTDKSKIFEYTISLPTENIASNFSSIQENISNMIFSNKSELKSLTHLRDTLLPKLITGELKVNEINN